MRYVGQETATTWQDAVVNELNHADAAEAFENVARSAEGRNEWGEAAGNWADAEEEWGRAAVWALHAQNMGDATAPARVKMYEDKEVAAGEFETEADRRVPMRAAKILLLAAGAAALAIVLGRAVS